MGVDVDHAGEHQEAGRVKRLGVRMASREAFPDGLNPPVADRHVRREAALGGDHGAAADKEIRFCHAAEPTAPRIPEEL